MAPPPGSTTAPVWGWRSARSFARGGAAKLRSKVNRDAAPASRSACRRAATWGRPPRLPKWDRPPGLSGKWGRSLKMYRILLVEDNELNRDMLKRRLSHRGYEVILAANGRQGIDMARSEKPDVVLMDLSLPEIDGWQAARILKNDAATRGIPVVALTAHAMLGDREKALEAACDDYATKPINMPVLLGIIGRLTC